jgi:hypothetical protein
MGRTLKRVPLDFDWPLNKTWPGYLNPHGGPCPEEGKTCFDGYTAAGKWIESVARLLSTMAEDAAVSGPEYADYRARRSYPHPYLTEWPQAPTANVPRDVISKIREHDDSATRQHMLHRYLLDNPAKPLPLTNGLRELVEALNDGQRIDQLSGSCASFRIARALVKAAGKDPETWGICSVCEGHADDPEKRAEAEAWEREGPPTGDGYQLWETTSEGSPVSPVFATMDELCAWCESNATTFGSAKTTAAEWRRMLDEDFVCHQAGNMVFL